ncbi:Glutamyl-tRNA(Gln) amidotransferase subunit A [Cyphellophora attinorum]|uniref:Glutamyl-tRNA(Gln) amidotransferase subunit A n=1 Tax=Cyphellophora attinorum TaxID=1664694 RepID=A0A0N0NIL1_9EURO|nr:Glutamyl-tRNA(Gln) amidotransferase subunit A [Phialophora attinorum]KPI35569.1 Glutamyl-tRNA(Gln) amidotransferase subunit A [Phialophora attinorum]
MDDHHSPSATSTLSELQSGALSVTDYTTRLLDRINKREPQIHAWAYLNNDAALSEAAIIDGVPTFNAPILTSQDATAVRLLREAGALIIGKTTTTQFASTTTGGPTVNPHSPPGKAHTPGGSSSGSAAAVADGHVPLALGTQTGGSIVRPASFCGVYGYKPTWGMVSTEGMARYSTTCDTVGFFARSVEDLELVASVFQPLAAIMGSASSPREVFPPGSGTKVALLKTHVWTDLDNSTPNLERAWLETRDRLIRAGYEPVEVSLPSEFAAMTTYHANILAHEAVAQFWTFYTNPEHRKHLDRVIVDGVEKGLQLSRSPETMREAYDGVTKLRTLWDEWAKVWDVIVTPSTRDCAPRGLEWTGDACFNAMWTALGAPCVACRGWWVGGEGG